MTLFSPMEAFTIFPVLNISLTLTNIIFYFILAASLTILFNSRSLFWGQNAPILGSSWNILSESLFRSTLVLIENFIGPKYAIFLPLFYSLFHLILFSNLFGLIPYSGTPTVEIIMTISIAITILIGILLFGFLTHNARLLAMFLPGGTPLALIPLMVVLEVIAYLARTLSLGLRLAINLITGHILAKVCSGFIWLGYSKGTSFFLLAFGLIALILFFTLEILVAYLQAYIFVFIALLTFKDITMGT